MISRERVRPSPNHRPPERVPVDCGVNAAVGTHVTVAELYGS